MKTYRVKYYLKDMLHTYLVDAKNEVEAIDKVIKGLHYPEIMHDFSIERYFGEWN